MQFESVFYELAAVLAVAAVAGIAAIRLRQPLIIAFIVVGVLVGPAGLSWVTSRDEMDVFARIGIAVLLFVVGLKLDIGLIRSVGPVALATGVGQIAFTSLFGFLIAIALGMPPLTATYVAVALTFSSTIIIVKLLSDKREIDSLHGRIAVGFLIVQDIFVVLAMIMLTALAAGSGGSVALDAVRLLAIGAAFVIGTVVAMRWLMPWLLARIARSSELMMVFAIAWAVGLGALGDAVGFSKEVGAFLGGVSIASTPYRDAIASRLTGIRDFLLLFFFIDLGTKLDLASIGQQVIPALVFSVFVLVGNPLIVIAIMGFMGYRRRTSMFAGLTVAQISEFSLILASLGVAVGHIGADTLGLVTLVGLVTIGASTYLIINSGKLYALVQGPLKVFERAVPFREIGVERATGPSRVDVVVIGIGRYGGSIASGLNARGCTVLGVDFDPHALRELDRRGIATQYGDSDDPEFMLSLPLNTAKWVVSTIPSLETNAAIAHGLQAAGYTGGFAATAHDMTDADTLHGLGTARVLLPFSDAADQAVDLLLEDLGRASADGSADQATAASMVPAT